MIRSTVLPWKIEKFRGIFNVVRVQEINI